MGLAEDDTLRCYLVIASSSLSLAAALVIIYVYFVHADFRTILRSSFNNLLVWAILLQGAQSVQRISAASIILADGMESVSCNIFGSVNVFLDMSSQTLLIGFYYKLTALRKNPFSCILKHFSIRTANFIQQYFFFSLAAVMGMGSVLLALGLLPLRPGTHCIYDTHYGWCSLPSPNRSATNATDLVFFLKVIVAAVVIACVAIGSFISFRVQFWTTFRCRQHWTIMFRWTSIIVFMIAAYFSEGILDLAGAPARSVDFVSSALFPLLGFFLGVVFIVSEKVWTWLIRRSCASLCCCGSSYSRDNSLLDEHFFGSSAEHAAKALNGFTNAINTLSVTEVVGESIWLGSRQVPAGGGGNATTMSGDEHGGGEIADDRDLFNSRTAGGTASRSQSVVVVRR